MSTASVLSDQQYRTDLDVAYRTLRREMDEVVKAYRAEQDLRRAMKTYNEGAAQAQVNFRAALQKAKGDLAARAREEQEDPWREYETGHDRG